MFITFSSLVAAVVLAIAAVAKLSRPRRLPAVLHRYGFFPKAAELPLSVGLVVTEGIVAFMLVASVGGWPRFAIAAALFLLFASVTALMLVRGKPVPCGCLGAQGDIHMGTLSVGFNLALVALLSLSAILVGTGAYVDGIRTSGVLWTAAAATGAMYWLVIYALSVVGAIDERLAAELDQ